MGLIQELVLSVSGPGQSSGDNQGKEHFPIKWMQTLGSGYQATAISSSSESVTFNKHQFSRCVQSTAGCSLLGKPTPHSRQAD